MSKNAKSNKQQGKGKHGSSVRTAPVAKAGKRCVRYTAPPAPVVHTVKVRAAGYKVLVAQTMTITEAVRFFGLNESEKAELIKFISVMETKGFAPHRTAIKVVR